MKDLLLGIFCFLCVSLLIVGSWGAILAIKDPLDEKTGILIEDPLFTEDDMPNATVHLRTTGLLEVDWAGSGAFSVAITYDRPLDDAPYHEGWVVRENLADVDLCNSNERYFADFNPVLTAYNQSYASEEASWPPSDLFVNGDRCILHGAVSTTRYTVRICSEFDGVVSLPTNATNGTKYTVDTWDRCYEEVIVTG